MQDADGVQEPQLFISYSHTDVSLVARLRADLIAAGARIWIDHEQLQPGAPDWEEAVRAGIQRAAFVLYIASPEARASQYVRDEINLARAKGRRVIPFWARGDEWHDCIPLGWGMTQHADGRGEHYPAGLTSLLGALGLRRADAAPGEILPESSGAASERTNHNARATPAPRAIAPALAYRVATVVAVATLAWAPDTRIASGGPDGVIGVWDGAMGGRLLTLTGGASPIYSVAWSPDGARLATAGADRLAPIWDALAGSAIQTLEYTGGDVLAIAWSPDGERLATGGRDHSVALWDARDGARLATLDGHTGAVYGVTWSPDGRLLASGSDDRTAIIWDTETQLRERTLHSHARDINGVAWSPDGERLATASDDATMAVWDVDSGARLMSLEGHTDRIRNVAWSPDGAWIASASYDHSARVWDARSGQQLAILAGHEDSVYAVAWSPTGARLATGSNDRTFRVWEVRG